MKRHVFAAAALAVFFSCVPAHAAGMIELKDGKKADYDSIKDLGDKVELTSGFGRKHEYDKKDIDFARSIEAAKAEAVERERALADFKGDLEVRDIVLDKEFKSGKWRLNGTLRNPSKTALENVRVQAKLYNSKGVPLKTAEGFTTPGSLDTGQLGVFSIELEPDTEIDVARTIIITGHK